jgi:hypothetical protein
VRVSPGPYLALPLAVHGLLADVPLQDVSAVDLPGGGPGRTLADVRALFGPRERRRVNPVVRLLFGIRHVLGRLFGWDAPAHERPELSYRARLPPDLVSRSIEPSGSMDGPFRVLYLFEREGLQEIRNATVHAFLAYALVEAPAGYRLYWAIYVKPISWFTPIYMALIEPFRRFVVYPALLGRLRQAWRERYLQA